MKMLTKIACRTVGTIGVGKALYEAVNLSCLYGRNGAQNEQAKYLEKAYFDSRTIDSVSYTSNAVRQKAFDLRSRNPIPSFWGRVKGGFQGATYALSDNLGIIACSAAALLSKGLLAKIGAVGVGISAAYTVIRDGFGFGKQHPMN